MATKARVSGASSKDSTRKRRHRRRATTGKHTNGTGKAPVVTPGRGQQGKGTRPNSGDEFAVVLEDVLATVPAAARDGFVRSVIDEPQDDLDPTLWGAAPDAVERKQAALTSLRTQYEWRRQVLQASLTRAEAAELLDVSEQAILDRLRAGDLIGLKQGREWRLPAWQFSPDTERGLIPGLARLSEAFPGGAVSMTTWATRPHADLGGDTPADRLTAGQVEDVIHVARIGTAAAW